MKNGFVETTLESPTGAQLQLYSRMPDRRVRAAIQINHGMAEHAARYQRFARALSEAGFAVFAHDHRGHGQTTAPDASPGVFGEVQGFEKVLEDVVAVNRHIRARDPDTPVICFGHSMGAIIALNFALRHPERLDGLACWNAGVETGALARISRLILGVEALLRGRNKPSSLARKLTFDAWNKVFKPNRTAFDWLSQDQAEVDLYVADRLCGFDVSIGLWLDLLGGVFYAGDDRHLTGLHKALPVHVLGGGADPCSNQGRDMQHLAARLRIAGLTDVTETVLADTRHESLNEINRDETTAAFIQWLNQRYQ
ncbi:MAG: lysophospholipase [Rhodobacteraceae bacterium]|nr:lysophospholipase [Paracoccaceae bacterium]